MPSASNPTKVVLKNRDFWLSGAAFGVLVFLWRRYLQLFLSMLSDGLSDILHGHYSIGGVFAGLLLLAFFLAVPAVSLWFFLKWAIRAYASKPDELQPAYKLDHSGTCKRHARSNCITCRRWQRNGSRCGVWVVAAATLFVVLGLGIFLSQFHEPDEEDDIQSTGYGLINSSAIGLYTVCGIILILIVSYKESPQPDCFLDRDNPPDMRFVDEPLELTWRSLSGGGSLPFLDSEYVLPLQIVFYSGWSFVVARSLSPLSFGLLRVAITSMTLHWIAIHWSFKYRAFSQGLRIINPGLVRRAARYQEEAERGDAEAQYKLGRLYELGQGVPIDCAAAAAWYLTAAERENADAQFHLAEMSRKGIAIPHNYPQTVAWYRQAAEKGHATAQYVLGMADGCGKATSEDCERAAEWVRYQEEAKKGHAEAQYQLGLLYGWGQGVPYDYIQAKAWFLKAAEQGHAEAQFHLGELYHQTDLIAQLDDEKAAMWYLKAAEQGHGQAQYALGQMYRFGQGVQRDSTEAAAWLKKTAYQGHAPAQRLLGTMYLSGEGVAIDYEEAYFLLSLVSACNIYVQERKWEEKERDAAAARLSPEKLANLQARSVKWLAEHQHE